MHLFERPVGMAAQVVEVAVHGDSQGLEDRDMPAEFALDRRHTGINFSAYGALDVDPRVAVHLVHRDRGQNSEGHEDGARHSRDLEVLLHRHEHSRSGQLDAAQVLSLR
jgi:hypothetical protein